MICCQMKKWVGWVLMVCCQVKNGLSLNRLLPSERDGVGLALKAYCQSEKARLAEF